MRSELSELTIGSARVASDAQDLAAQPDALQPLDVDPERIHVDRELCGPTATAPRGVRQSRAAPATSWSRPSLDGLARSLLRRAPDRRQADE